MAGRGPVGPRPTGLRRSWELLGAFRQEQHEPARAYRRLARDTVELVGSYLPLAGATAIDVGGGPGYTAEALRSAGAWACTLEYDAAELSLHGRTPDHAVVADGLALPVGTATVDLACSLNALEHVRHPWTFLDELVRITRPGGLVFLGLTNWRSPWGGHETSPWHHLGGERAARRYERLHGRPPKNRYGHTLFEVHIGDVLRWARHHPDVAVRDAFPRYYPAWCRPLVQIPGLREVATWNLALALERT